MSEGDAGGTGDDADDEPPGPRPSPLDRPWVHPSELSSYVGTPVLPEREARPRDWAIGLGSAFVGVVVTLLVLVAFGALGGRHRPAVPPAVVTTPTDPFDYSRGERVAETIVPSLVTVQVTAPGTPARTVAAGLAVGSNRVLTLLHTLPAGATLQVVAHDGGAHPAKVTGGDPMTDVALLSVPDGDLTWAPIQPSTPRVGTPLVLVAPKNLTVWTTGMNYVSDRNVMADTGTGIPVVGLISVDVAATADWVGGVLVDGQGNVVGLVTWPAQPVARVLAIPGLVARDDRDQLDASGKASHGWFGLQLAPDDPAHPSGGARVVAVVPGSAAAKAGLVAGDVVTQAGGEGITGSADLLAAIRARRPQDPLDVSFTTADGRRHQTQVTLGTADPAVVAANPLSG